MERYKQFTALLIIVTFAFVILTLPACIYFVFFRNDLASKSQKDYRFMIQILLNSIQFTSHGINFFLYCFSAESFRHELRGMFEELISNCHCSCRVALNDTRQNGHIMRYVHNNEQFILERQRINRDREIQMNRYKFSMVPEYRSSSDKRPNWG
jgi:hypothetical protein